MRHLSDIKQILHRYLSSVRSDRVAAVDTLVGRCCRNGLRTAFQHIALRQRDVDGYLLRLLAGELHRHQALASHKGILRDGYAVEGAHADGVAVDLTANGERNAVRSLNGKLALASLGTLLCMIAGSSQTLVVRGLRTSQHAVGRERSLNDGRHLRARNLLQVHPLALVAVQQQTGTLHEQRLRQHVQVAVSRRGIHVVLGAVLQQYGHNVRREFLDGGEVMGQVSLVARTQQDGSSIQPSVLQRLYEQHVDVTIAARTLLERLLGGLRPQLVLAVPGDVLHHQLIDGSGTRLLVGNVLHVGILQLLLQGAVGIQLQVEEV